MDAIFALLGLISACCILLGLIKPTIVLRWGKKRTRWRAVGWYWLFMMIFFGLAGATSQKGQKIASNEPKPQTNNASEQASRQLPNNGETQKYKIGDEVSAGKFNYIVNSAKFVKRIGNSMMAETADGVFLVVNLAITNTDKETRTLDASLFKIKDYKNVEYDASHRGDTALEMSGGKTIFLKQCQPNIPTKGSIVFEVPAQGDYTLILSGGYWSGKKAEISLQ